MPLASYEELRNVDIKKYCKKRDGLDYLNWASYEECSCCQKIRKCEKELQK